MVKDGKIVFAKAGDDFSEDIVLLPKMANRHGFVGGATGTGKSVTLKVLAESFSALGVPVFVTDVKGDLSGFITEGADSESMQKRIEKFNIKDSFKYQSYPARFFDIYGELGIPLRTTVTEMGPLLMAESFGLNDTQTELLTVVYKIADDQNLLLIDTKDLKAMLNYVSENASQFEADYGNIPKATVSTIIRAIVASESDGADKFFGEPAIDINDFFQVAPDGRGMINVLEAQTLINKPQLYTAFLLYFMSEFFEQLPEQGDAEKPKMVLFFDEAHLIFDNAGKALLDKIVQVIKLIRSKGVGIYFVTQSPGDIPDDILSQLSTKIEHALRAYSPKELKAVKTAAESFRTNPDFDTADLIQNLGTGEAVVSLLDEGGIPTIAQHAYILPPESFMGEADFAAKTKCMQEDALADKYTETIDRDSCYEFMQRRKAQADDDAAAAKAAADEAAAKAQAEKEAAAEAKAQAAAEKEAAKEQAAAEKEAAAKAKAAEKKQKAVKQASKSVLSSTAGTIGRELGKSLGSSVGGSFGKTLGGNVGASIGRNLLGTLFKL